MVMLAFIRILGFVKFLRIVEKSIEELHVAIKYKNVPHCRAYLEFIPL